MDQDDDNRSGKQWHLEKSVSISHIFSTILIAGSLFSYANGMDKRIEINAIEIVNLSSLQHRDEADFRDFKSEMHSMIEQVNTKLDRIIERVISDHQK